MTLTPEQEERLRQLYEAVQRIKRELEPFEDLRDARAYRTKSENDAYNQLTEVLGRVFGDISELENTLRTSR